MIMKCVLQGDASVDVGLMTRKLLKHAALTRPSLVALRSNRNYHEVKHGRSMGVIQYIYFFYK